MKRIHVYHEAHKDEMIADYKSMKLKEFLRKWHIGSDTWTKLKPAWGIEPKMIRFPAPSNAGVEIETLQTELRFRDSEIQMIKTVNENLRQQLADALNIKKNIDDAITASIQSCYGCDDYSAKFTKLIREVHKALGTHIFDEFGAGMLFAARLVEVA